MIPLHAAGNWSGDTEPPDFTVYNMGSDEAPMVDKGAYMVDSEVVGLWGMDLARSFFRNVRCIFLRVRLIYRHLSFISSSSSV